MELFAEKNFVQVEKKSIFFYRMLGFSPFLSAQKTLKSSEIFMMCWSFMVLIIFTVISSMVVRNQENIFNENSIGKVNDILKFSCATVAAYIIILESLINVKKFRKFYEEIDAFNIECKLLNVNFNSYNGQMAKVYACQFISFISMQFFVETFVMSSVDWTEFWIANILPACTCRIRHL